MKYIKRLTIATVNLKHTTQMCITVYLSSVKTNKFKNNKNRGGAINNNEKIPMINGSVTQAKAIPKIIKKITLFFFNRNN